MEIFILMASVFFAIVSVVLSFVYLRGKAYIKSLLFGVCVIPLELTALYYWNWALVSSGKNPAWLGIERYPEVVCFFVILCAAALFCIGKSIVQLRKK